MKKYKELFELFNNNGYELFIVGGFVRDGALGLVSDDVDFTTDATEKEKQTMLQEAGYEVLTTGELFSVTNVKVGNEWVEIATYRERGHGANSDDAIITDSVVRDLERRDFTINTLLMDQNGEIIDHLGGLEDLNNKVIRSVGNANERMEEDPARILRAYRFAAQKGFTIDEELHQALQGNAFRLAELPVERIGNELRKILKSSNPEIIIDMIQDGIFDFVNEDLAAMAFFNQESPYHNLTLDEHTRAVMEGVSQEGNFLLNAAALLHDIGKPNVKSPREKGGFSYIGHEEEGFEILNRGELRELLGLTKKEYNLVKRLVLEHGGNQSKPKHLWSLNQKGWTVAEVELLIKLQHADANGHPNSEARLARVNKFAQTLNVVSKSAPWSLKELAITGSELVQIGLSGPAIGQTLTSLHHQAFLQPHLNNKSWLLKAAKRGQ